MANPILDSLSNLPVFADSSNAGMAGLEKALASGDGDSDTLKKLEASMRKQTEAVAANIKSIEEDQAKQSGARKLIGIAQEKAGQAALTIKNQELTTRMQVENDTNAAFQAGGGPDELQEAYKNFSEDSQRVSDILDAVTENAEALPEGAGYFATVGMKFREHQIKTALEAAEAKQVQSRSRLAGLTAGISDVKAANTAAAVTVNQGTIDASLRVIESNTAMQLAENDIAASATNAKAVADVLASTRVEVLTRQQALSNEQAVADAEYRELAMEQRKVEFANTLEQQARNVEREDIQLENLKEATRRSEVANAVLAKNAPALQLEVETRAAEYLQIQAEVKAGNEASVKYISNAQAIVSGGDMSKVEAPDVILAGLKTPGDIGNAYRTMYMVGKTGVLGATPFDAKVNYMNINPTGGGVQSSSSKLLANIDAAMQANNMAAGIKVPTDRAQAKTMFNAQAQAIASSSAAVINPNDRSNPYIAPPMATLLKAAAVRDSVIYKKVLAPLDLATAEPQIVINSALAAYKADTITSDEAIRGIVAIYSKAAALNNTMDGGFARIGFPEQSSYNAPIKGVRGFFANTGEHLIHAALRGLVLESKHIAKLSRSDGTADEFRAGYEQGRSFAPQDDIVNMMDYSAVELMWTRRVSALEK